MATIAILRVDMSRSVAGRYSHYGGKERSMVEIRPMGPQIGVEVSGVDVRTLDDAGFAPIYQAWLDYNILCVRDQDLTIPEFVAYSRRFGPVVPHPSKSTRHPHYPEITTLGVDKFDANGRLRPGIYPRRGNGAANDGV